MTSAINGWWRTLGVRIRPLDVTRSGRKWATPAAAVPR